VATRLRISGHPIQPVLVTFPVGLFACAVLFDLARVFGAPRLVGEVGYWTVTAGLVAAGLTLVAGLVELWDVPERSPVRRPAVTLLQVNGAMTGMFLLVCVMRAAPAARTASGGLVAVEALALTIGGLGILLGVRSMHTAAPIVVDPASGGLDLVTDEALVKDEAMAREPHVRRSPAAP
jgi:uncharacterized membrane protein